MVKWIEVLGGQKDGHNWYYMIEEGGEGAFTICPAKNFYKAYISPMAEPSWYLCNWILMMDSLEFIEESVIQPMDLLTELLKFADGDTDFENRIIRDYERLGYLE